MTAGDRFARVAATWFGCGLAPVAPGTVGSLAALGLAWALHAAFGWDGWAFGVLALLFSPLAIWSAGRAAAGEGEKDPGIVVVDEVAGQWLALAGAVRFGWPTWVGAFLLFRLLDIWKPPPARRLERLEGGLGIVADDLMAGLYAAAALYGAGRWWGI